MRTLLRTTLRPAAALLLLLAAGCATFDPETARRDQTGAFRETLAADAVDALARPLSLDDCLALAMDRNYDVRKAALDTELARLGRNVAFGAFLPQVTLSAGHTSRDYKNVQGATTAGDLVIGPKADTSAALTASLPIFLPSTWFLYAAARHNYALAGIAERYVRQGIVLQTTAAYCDVLLQQDTVAALEAQRYAAEQLSERVSGLADEGLVRSWEASQARVQAMKCASDLAAARRQLVVERADLMRLLGFPADAPFELSGDLPPAAPPAESMEDLVFEALLNSPQLAIADRQVVMKEHAVRQAFCAFLPTLSLNATHAWGGEDFALEAVGWSTGFQAAWSVFSSFTDVARTRAAKIDKRQTELERENTFLSVIVAVVAARNAVDDAAEAAAFLEENARALREKHDDLAARAEEGLVPVSDALEALADANAAEVALVQSRYAERLAIANLELVLGRTAIPGEEPAEALPEEPAGEDEASESRDSSESSEPSEPAPLPEDQP